MLVFNNKEIATDAEGYLRNLDDWSVALASYLAELEEITLTEQHWLIINFVRDYFTEFGTTPGMRLLVSNLKRKFGEEVGNSRYLQRMFNQSPAKTVAKLAGLPKPAKCL